MTIRSFFTQPSKPAFRGYAYGGLAVILVLLAFNMALFFWLSAAYHHRFMNLAVVLMLLFNHLAYQFRLPTPITVALRILASGWLLAGGIYIGYCLYHP